MSEKPKRRWFQFSLKAMLVVLTLFCVFVGGRIEYLRRWAAFHEREANSIGTALFEMTEEVTPGQPTRVLKKGRDEKEHYRAAVTLVYHQKMQERYGAAVYRPWTLVNDDKRQDKPREKDNPFR